MFEFLKRLFFRKKDQDSRAALDDPLKEPGRKWFNFSFFKKSKQRQTQPNKYNFNQSEDEELAELFHDELPKAKPKPKSITARLISAVKSISAGAKRQKKEQEGTEMTSTRTPQTSQNPKRSTIDF